MRMWESGKGGKRQGGGRFKHKSREENKDVYFCTW